MRKVHLISVSEPLMLDLALALKEKGYEVSTSGCGLTEDQIHRLEDAGCVYYGDGWFPDRLVNPVYSVVLGSTVFPDNPELVRAREMGLMIQSIPEFLFQRVRTKTRVVVAGTRGKRSILAMIMWVLKRQKMSFDFALASEMPPVPRLVSLSYEARIALIEGDERMTSCFDRRFRLEFYRPHIAVVTNLLWKEAEECDTPEAFREIYHAFSSSVERDGKIIYFESDDEACLLAKGVREDITAIPCAAHPVKMVNGETCLDTRFGDIPVYVPNDHFLVNLNAARLACRLLGVRDLDFYQGVSEYSLSLRK